MKFAHLPVEGGWYDQHPQLVDEWTILFRLDNEYQKLEHDRIMNEAKSKAKSRSR